MPLKEIAEKQKSYGGGKWLRLVKSTASRRNLLLTWDIPLSPVSQKRTTAWRGSGQGPRYWCWAVQQGTFLPKGAMPSAQLTMSGKGRYQSNARLLMFAVSVNAVFSRLEPDLMSRDASIEFRRRCFPEPAATRPAYRPSHPWDSQPGGEFGRRADPLHIPAAGYRFPRSASRRWAPPRGSLE